MSGRGRGLRIHRIEPPKPRKSSANTLEALQQQVNGLLIKIKQGSVLPNEAKTFNEALKNMSLMSKDQFIKEYLSNVVQVLRSCLMTVVFSPVVRMYLLEIIELSASNWDRNYLGCHYYNQKAEDTAFTCKPPGKLKLHHSLSHPGQETNVMRKPFSNHAKNKVDLLSQARPIQRLSKEISTDNSLLSFKVAVRSKFFLLAKGHKGINILNLEKQTETQIVYDGDTGNDNCIVTIMGTNESDIWRAVSMLEHLVLHGSLPEEATELNQTRSRSLGLFSELGLSDSKPPQSPSDLTEDSGFEDTTQVYVYPQQTGQLQGNGSYTITPEARRSSDVTFICHKDRRNSDGRLQTTDDFSMKAEGHSNKKECALYIKGHILKLHCDNKQILQEAITVLTAHFDNTSDRNNSVNILATINSSSQVEITGTPKHQSSPLSLEITNGDKIAISSAGQSPGLLNSQGWIKSDELAKYISQVPQGRVEGDEAEKKIRSTQKVIQYGRHFLLTCSMSPLAREVPEDWQNRNHLPEVCLFKPPSYFDPSKYTLPALLPKADLGSHPLKS